MIKKSFVDYDGNAYHPDGVLTFIRSCFLPYDEGLTLYFEIGDERIAFRLQWREETQAGIINHLDEYIVET